MEGDKDKQSFVVQAEDGRKFMMVIRGDLNKLPVEKIKRYLRSYGVPDGQSLTYNGKALTDEMLGEDFGLAAGAVLRLWSSTPLPPVLNAQQTVAESLGVDVEGRQRQREYEERMSRATRAPPPPPVTSDMSDLLTPAQRFARMTLGAGADGGTSPAATVRSNPAYVPSTLRNDGSISSSIIESHHPLNSKIVSLEDENARLRRDLEALKFELDKKKPGPPSESLLLNAKANLHELGKELGLHLSLDQNLTCVVGSDERNTLLVTFDAATERLYIYSTILSFIPEDAATRLKLFETLLDGALLGRDMAGGGCGVSLQSGIIMMSTSIQLANCDQYALKAAIPGFVESLVRWRNVAAEICASNGQSPPRKR
jgi:hypothetical protein